MKRFVVGLLLLVISINVAWADPPYTRRSSQMHGEKDGWVPRADLAAMATAMPDCRLVRIPGVGHSMNVEQPALYAGCSGAWFGGLGRKGV